MQARAPSLTHAVERERSHGVVNFLELHSWPTHSDQRDKRGQYFVRPFADLIDRGLEDYMIETAMLKVFTTDRLWEAVNDAFQLHGGSAYFDDNPLGRML